MNRGVLIAVFIVSCILQLPLFVAAQNRDDSLRLALDKVHAGEFAGALSIYRALMGNRDMDAETARLYAQCLYWSGNETKALETYDTLASMFPENPELQFDYGVILTDLGQYRQAAKILEPLAVSFPKNERYAFRLATLYYWKGNWIRAKVWNERTLSRRPDHPEALTRRKALDDLTATRMEAVAGWAFDRQPLDSYTASVLWTKATGQLTQWSASFEIRRDEPGNGHNSQAWARIGNRSDWKWARMAFTYGLGLYTNSEQTEISWEAGISRTFAKRMELYAGGGRTPYRFTASSIRQPLSHVTFQAGWRRSPGGGWLGNIFVEYDWFPDDNKILTLAAWILSPPVNFGPLSLAAGYGYHNGHADENRFAPVRTAREIAMEQDSDYHVDGIYNPYFTPERTRSHSVLANLRIKMPGSFELSCNAGYGVSGETDQPYLYLDKDGEEFFIARDFIREQYDPVGIDIGLRFPTDSHWVLTPYYQYRKTIFYESHQLGIRVKWTRGYASDS